MLEKSIKRFKENVLEIEQAIARDADASTLQALDESLRQTFLEIQHFKSDCGNLRRIQISFFLEYISDLSENDLVDNLVHTVGNLVERYVGDDDQPSSAFVDGQCPSGENCDAAP